MAVTAGFAGLGGDVHYVEPGVEFKSFRRGLRPRHVIGVHFSGHVLLATDGLSLPPFVRYQMGGEAELRGFDNGSTGPIVSVPGTAQVDVFNNDGSPRTVTVLDPNGNHVRQQVTMPVALDRALAPGGDTKLVANIEYRIPLIRWIELVAFDDIGSNRIRFADQLRLTRSYLDVLNFSFPDFGATQPHTIANTARPRMSTGLELRVRVPRMQLPLRVYWAYNPWIVREGNVNFFAPDRAAFPNKLTFDNAASTLGAPIRYAEPRNSIRVSIGRTF